MAWDALHAKAKGVLPNLEIPAKRYWIGVLHHDKSPEEQLSESDFQWMKAHAVRQPLNTYFEAFGKRIWSALRSTAASSKGYLPNRSSPFTHRPKLPTRLTSTRKLLPRRYVQLTQTSIPASMSVSHLTVESWSRPL
jgi:hypothetical protein